MFNTSLLEHMHNGEKMVTSKIARDMYLFCKVLRVVWLAKFASTDGRTKSYVFCSGQIRIMLRLHLPRAWYDLFVYDFPYGFQASWE